MDTRQQIIDVLQQESAAIAQAATLVGETAEAAVNLLQQCDGRVIVTGMGKMGCIARKAAATFCSTGTPAIFLHPSEAAHGDLGILGDTDVLMLLSNSGETREVLELLPFAARMNVKTIAITAGQNSSLATQCDTALETGVVKEADSIAIAPTNSTTVTLAICDALAVALMEQRGFTREQFAIFHPGGYLGRKLLIKVSDVMRSADQLPVVSIKSTLAQAIQAISDKHLGAVFAVDQNQSLSGVLTDGDLRRIIESSAADMATIIDQEIESMITSNPKTTAADRFAAEALRTMETNNITILPVVNEANHLQGVVHLHDLIRAGLA
ncbi:KpsF/GutQ family sugar-phosphate isomerase [Mariniblastus sp.]|nr:KpsF/GutQ family sugar-phosphate isomerase [Mariniblastus sp.]